MTTTNTKDNLVRKNYNFSKKTLQQLDELQVKLGTKNQTETINKVVSIAEKILEKYDVKTTVELVERQDTTDLK